MMAAIDDAKKNGDTLGGVCEIVVQGLPIGLGDHTQWDRKLDGRIAQAMMSIQAIKGVEIGLGFKAATLSGSQVHDPIHLHSRQSRHAEWRIPPADKWRRRIGRRHHQRVTAGRALRDEADQYVDEAVDVRRFKHRPAQKKPILNGAIIARSPRQASSARIFWPLSWHKPSARSSAAIHCSN